MGVLIVFRLFRVREAGCAVVGNVCVTPVCVGVRPVGIDGGVVATRIFRR